MQELIIYRFRTHVAVEQCFLQAVHVLMLCCSKLFHVFHAHMFAKNYWRLPEYFEFDLKINTIQFMQLNFLSNMHVSLYT